MSDRKENNRGLEEAPIYYINNAAVSRSPFDFKFTLGTLETADKHQITTRVAALVYMSPQHTKAFHDALTKQLRKYEEAFGKIVLEAINPEPQDDAKAQE